MIEIYKETLRDLLCANPLDPNSDLKIKEDPRRGTYVEGLSEIYVGSKQELLEVITSGDKMRQVACTKLN